MPLVFQRKFPNQVTVGVWHIEEKENFFRLNGQIVRNIPHPHKRLQHLAGRFLLQQLNKDLQLGDILIDENNKPYFENDHCHFSISHCGDYAAVVVSEQVPAGIDVEVISPLALKLSSKFMNRTEMDFLTQDVKEDRKIATAIWSIKEAVFKWYGKGKVDFKKDIVVGQSPLTIVDNTIPVSFYKEGGENLDLHIHWLDDYVLVWVCK